MAAGGGEVALELRLAGKRFAAMGGAPERHVLGPLRLTLRRGEVAALTGPSGCGKTTLLNLVAGLDRDFVGSVERPGRGRLAYVFQEPRLLPWRTVTANLALVLPDGPAAAVRISAALAEVGLEDAAETYAGRLSLGMARRLALARAFVVEPALLLLDEPFASLDAPTAHRLRLLLLDLLARHEVTLLFVTHDLAEAVMVAHRLLVLAGMPARLAAEIPIGLPPAARRDRAAVAAVAARLREQVHPVEPAP
jgi:NitT/TauT family transport system ATP-binding protein